LVTAGKHVKNIRAIARQPPITKIEELLKAVFSAGSGPDLYSEDPRRLREFGCEIFPGQEGPERGKLKNLHC
jgi:hypothetical protein